MKKKTSAAEQRRPYKWVRVPADLYEHLAAIAEASDRSVNREAVRAIREYVQRDGKGDR
jgi:predicted transcriptional regulator